MASHPTLHEIPPGQGARSSGVTYQDLLDADTREVPEVLRWQSAAELPAAKVAIERYTSRAFHDLEVERVWKKVWQFACREEELLEVGDHAVYEIADLSVIVTRSAPDEIKAFRNVCLHRGRKLRDEDGRVADFRCPFHGWTWNLDGSLKTVPCRWDFPNLEKDAYELPQLQVGTWGGFVFVNFDPDCGPLEEFLGDLPKHFEPWPLEDRAKTAHVAKILPCNWKVAQEAFMEAYHVVATHPQMLPGIGDANSQYDAWGNFSRAITANMTPSPHLEEEVTEQDQLDAMFTRSLDADAFMTVPESMTARQILAQATRMGMQANVPGITKVSDAELADSFYYTLFPNFHPWGAYNRIVYRFRPYGNDPDQAIMEVIYLEPFRGKRPKPAPVHWLSDDEDFTCAPELGFLARVFNQDTGNFGQVQAGLHAAGHTHVTFGEYQETKLRHFHALLDQYVSD
jgi:phenylpropionate dioxygenase-like ring-hydroxylating dioxygenase large terminal subunit